MPSSPLPVGQHCASWLLIAEAGRVIPANNRTHTRRTGAPGLLKGCRSERRALGSHGGTTAIHSLMKVTTMQRHAKATHMSVRPGVLFSTLRTKRRPQRAFEGTRTETWSASPAHLHQRKRIEG